MPKFNFKYDGIAGVREVIDCYQIFYTPMENNHATNTNTA